MNAGIPNIRAHFCHSVTIIANENFQGNCLKSRKIRCSTGFHIKSYLNAKEVGNEIEKKRRNISYFDEFN